MMADQGQIESHVEAIESGTVDEKIESHNGQSVSPRENHLEEMLEILPPESSEGNIKFDESASIDLPDLTENGLMQYNDVELAGGVPVETPTTTAINNRNRRHKVPFDSLQWFALMLAILALIGAALWQVSGFMSRAHPPDGKLGQPGEIPPHKIPESQIDAKEEDGLESIVKMLGDLSI